MNVGFDLFAVGVFLWASIDYNRFIKLWIHKPAPYTRQVKFVFRAFFLACVGGGLWGVAEDIARSEKRATFYLAAIPFTGAWFVVFYFMLRMVEWMNRKREINSNHST